VADGFTLLELLFVMALVLVLSGIAIPQTLATIDASRATAAARYLSGRLQLARTLAVQRSAAVAIRFETDGRDVRFSMYQDGNHNGVRTRDIEVNIDRQIEQPVRLSELFPGADFGLTVDQQNADPIQLGGPDLLTFTPAGTSTSGSLYLKGRDGSQYAVRVLGATGRTRLQRYDERKRKWSDEF
jgi:prepilin-type N-terminal cleavage/methylation domain-containing protein